MAETVLPEQQRPALRVDANLERWRDQRSTAREIAESELARRGFRLVESPDDVLDKAKANSGWRGVLPIRGAADAIVATVTLPDEFPDAMPRVYVDRRQLPRRIAHIEETGHICIVPTTGVLLDADRPDALIDEALRRAELTLQRGFDSESDVDLLTEWLAYWEPTDTARTFTICRESGPVRRLVLCRVKGPPPFNAGVDLIADSNADATSWISNLRGELVTRGEALFLPVLSRFDPPEFGANWTVRDVLSIIEKHCAVADVRAMWALAGATVPPLTVVLSLPEVAGSNRILVGIRFEKLSGDETKRTARGFRPGHVPTSRLVRMTAGSRVGRLNLARFDSRYLTARGGAAETLLTKTVAIVGVGAVGSEIASGLAALGVGRLRLIDSDTLGPENVQRHALGVRDVWLNKAKAMASELGSRYPHLTFEAVDRDIEQVLQSNSATLLSADLVVVALGDETLERRLNRVLMGGPPRIHAWVEPLGIGGHVLGYGFLDPATPSRPRPGCYECLLTMDRQQGLVNQAALVAPGQEIRRSLAGCAGTFSPFSSLDANKTALEAVELAGLVLTGDRDDTVLVTWRGDHTAFDAAGYRVSRRGRDLDPGSRVRVAGPQLVRPDCPVCGSGA